MIIDKKTLDSVSKLSDGDLALLIRSLAPKAGVGIPDNFTNADIAKIRTLLSSLGSLDSGKIAELAKQVGLSR